MNKKILLSLGGTTALLASIIAPILVVSSERKTNNGNKKILFDMDDPTEVDVKTNKTGFYSPESGSIISSDNQSNFWSQKNGDDVRDPNKWYSDYKNDEFDHYDAKMEFNLAKEYGWSLDDYAKYVRYHYEETTSEASNTFGEVTPMISGSWIAFHPIATGRAWDGHSSPIKPSYDGSETVALNGVNNKLNWYGFQDATKTFVFDQNNLENAFKRLNDSSVKRLFPVNLAEAQEELGYKVDPNDPTKLVNTTRDAEEGSKFIMINGQLRPFSWFYENDRSLSTYYYVTVNGSDDFIRDENGWKVLVSPDSNTWEDSDSTNDQADEPVLSREQALDKLFTTVLNPINSNAAANAKTKFDTTSKNDFQPVLKPLNARFNDQSDKPIILDKGGNNVTCKDGLPKDTKSIDFTDNKTIDYKDYTVKNLGGLPKAIKTNGVWDYDFTDVSVAAQGAFKMTYKEKTWLDLVKSRSFVLPFQFYNINNVATKDRVAKSVSVNFDEGGDMNWTWAEDGNGGHKIYKKINIGSPRTWTPDEAKSIIGDRANEGHTWDEVHALIYQSVKNPAKRFWGNFHHVFPDREAFIENNDIAADGGY